MPGADEVIFATHCHNDLGMATANALAAVEGGARQIECTINGLGERAGNTALEEVVMAMKVRRDIMPYTTGIDTTKIMAASRMVAQVSGFAVQYNKAIVGKNAFAHESGIHQDGMLKNAETFEIMRPEDVGLSETNIVMGKHSGRAALRAKLSDLGFELGDNQLKDVFVRFKELADRKKEVFLTLLLDSKNRVLREIQVSEGSLNASIVHPREVFQPVIRESAAAVLFVHNHPSGDPAPSREDLELTSRLRDAGALMGVRVLDHIIIGSDRYVSLADRGLFD